MCPRWAEPRFTPAALHALTLGSPVKANPVFSSRGSPRRRPCLTQGPRGQWKWFTRLASFSFFLGETHSPRGKRAPGLGWLSLSRRGTRSVYRGTEEAHRPPGNGPVLALTPHLGWPNGLGSLCVPRGPRCPPRPSCHPPSVPRAPPRSQRVAPAPSALGAPGSRGRWDSAGTRPVTHSQPPGTSARPGARSTPRAARIVNARAPRDPRRPTGTPGFGGQSAAPRAVAAGERRAESVTRPLRRCPIPRRRPAACAAMSEEKPKVRAGGRGPALEVDSRPRRPRPFPAPRAPSAAERSLGSQRSRRGRPGPGPPAPPPAAAAAAPLGSPPPPAARCPAVRPGSAPTARPRPARRPGSAPRLPPRGPRPPRSARLPGPRPRPGPAPRSPAQGRPRTRGGACAAPRVPTLPGPKYPAATAPHPPEHSVSGTPCRVQTPLPWSPLSGFPPPTSPDGKLPSRIPVAISDAATHFGEKPRPLPPGPLSGTAPPQDLLCRRCPPLLRPSRRDPSPQTRPALFAEAPSSVLTAGHPEGPREAWPGCTRWQPLPPPLLPPSGVCPPSPSMSPGVPHPPVPMAPSGLRPPSPSSLGVSLRSPWRPPVCAPPWRWPQSLRRPQAVC